VLTGAIVGTIASHTPVVTELSVRLGMLLVLPASGATVGLAVSGLVPPVESTARRAAVLQRRSLGLYVSPGSVRLVWAACAFTGVLALIRLVLPPESPFSEAVLSQLGGGPVLAPTRMMYVVVAVVAAVLTATAWAAAIAVVHRGRPAADADDFARQDRARRQSVRRLISGTTATLLLLNATLMTPFPRKMGGVVFGDVQLVQRVTDMLIVTLVIGAAVVTIRTYLGSGTETDGVPR